MGRKDRYNTDIAIRRLLRLCIVFGLIVAALAAVLFFRGRKPGENETTAAETAAETAAVSSEAETAAPSAAETQADTGRKPGETYEIAFSEEDIAQASVNDAGYVTGFVSDINAIPAGTELNLSNLDQNHPERYFTIREIREGDPVFQRINGKSYRKNNDVALEDICYLKLLHLNFRGQIQVGEMIVHRSAAKDIREIFLRLFSAGYQIEKMHLVDNYWTGDPGTTDSNSIEYNNTSAFNYRNATGSGHLSKHAYGLAVDLNPQQNPYVSYSGGSAKWYHRNADEYIDRSSGLPHVITHEDLAFRIFSEYGFTWGGDWNSIKDYQHFERGLREERWDPEEDGTEARYEIPVPEPVLFHAVGPKVMYTSCDPSGSVNVRAKPDIACNISGSAQVNDEFTVTGISDGWAEVDWKDGKAYISLDYLSEEPVEIPEITKEPVSLREDMKYAGNSQIHSGSAVLYRNNGGAHGDRTVCVNAGHGTSGGTSKKTLSHPDGSPKLTGGTNPEGAVYSASISYGMQFKDGTYERDVNLKTAVYLRDILLERGYSVLMIRESEDVQLDNIARTVLANTYADCHIAIHWDSGTSDKGAFFLSVPDGLKKIEPCASVWEKDEALGEALIEGLRRNGQPIHGSGSMDMDLTQTSYSSVASVDIELGDQVSDHSDARLEKLAEALADGIDLYFEK